MTKTKNNPTSWESALTVKALEQELEKERAVVREVPREWSRNPRITVVTGAMGNTYGWVIDAHQEV